MGKYDPLTVFLVRRKGSDVSLSFRDIERIVGGILPKAARDERWWTDADNTDPVPPQRRAWHQANYTPSVDLKAETVRFVRKG